MAMALATLGVAGCAKYTPAPLDPHRELVALRDQTLNGLVVQRAAPGCENAPAQPVRFDLADGLDEAELVAVALTLNPDLRAKRLEIGEAQALLISAGLWPNPELGVSWLPGIGGASGYKVDTDLLFELLRPGERRARKQAAQARVDEVKAEIIAEEYRTVGEVRRQRQAVLAGEQSVQLLMEEEALRAKTLDLVRQRRGIGEGTELDVSLAELELAEVRRDLRKTRTELASERLELNRLTGLPPEYPLHLAESGKPLTITVFDDIGDEELDRRILAGRFELRAKEAGYRKAEEGLRLAILQQYPRLKAGPAYSRELGGENSLGPGLSLELPLFNRNQGEIAEKQAVRDQKQAEYTALLHRLRASAYAARAALRSTRQEVETQEREVLPLVKRNQELFEGAFRAREMNVLDWVTAQQRTLRARREYLGSLARYQAALVQLEVATGLPLRRPATQPTTQPSTMQISP